MTELTVAYLAERTNALLTRVDQLLLGQVLVATQTFDSSTTDADPGAGEFRFNHATFASITKVWLDNLDSSGDTISTWIDRWDDSTSTIKGTLVIRGLADGTQFRIFEVTGSVVDKTGYRELTVTPIASDGGAFTAGGQYAPVFIRTGDKGATSLGTSTTSLALGTGEKVFTTQSGLAYAVGTRVRAASAATPTTKYMEGVVTAYSGTSLTVTMDYAVGSSTHADWNINLSGEGAPGAAAAAASAAAAATSETNAASSATAASGSATAAATSATNAAASATDASNSATAAATAETNAETAEAAAEAAQAAAETAETNAETAATSASSSASAASTSATNAATSATNAAASETAAETAETNAAASASAAAASATAADGHADRAEAAQAAAEAMVDIEWQGEWDDETTYSLADAVSFGGNAYISIQGSNTNQQPDEEPLYWHLLGTLGTGDVIHTRQILAGAGLSGGGDLSADRTLSLNIHGLSDTATASGDAVAFADASDTNAPKKRTWANIITDLGLATASDITSAINALKASVDAAGDTLAELYALILLRAPIESPTLTGTPAAPTAAAATNTTQIATTAFVQQELASISLGGWQTRSGNDTAESGESLLFTASATLTLPATPSAGDSVKFAANPGVVVTLDLNGSTLEGDSAAETLVGRGKVELVYDGSTWRVF